MRNKINNTIGKPAKRCNQKAVTAYKYTRNGKNSENEIRRNNSQSNILVLYFV